MNYFSCIYNKFNCFFLMLQLQLLTELRGLMKPQDIKRFNELTVHKEIMANKVNRKYTLKFHPR